jgi:hypothetical protein
MLNAKVRNNERARFENDRPTNKSAPQRGRFGDDAPLGLEDVLLGWVSINMPALRASDLRHAQSVPGPEGKAVTSHRSPRLGGHSNAPKMGGSRSSWSRPYEGPSRSPKSIRQKYNHDQQKQCYELMTGISSRVTCARSR